MHCSFLYSNKKSHKPSHSKRFFKLIIIIQRVFEKMSYHSSFTFKSNMYFQMQFHVFHFPFKMVKEDKTGIKLALLSSVVMRRHQVCWCLTVCILEKSTYRDPYCCIECCQEQDDKLSLSSNNGLVLKQELSIDSKMAIDVLYIGTCCFHPFSAKFAEVKIMRTVDLVGQQFPCLWMGAFNPTVPNYCQLCSPVRHDVQYTHRYIVWADNFITAVCIQASSDKWLTPTPSVLECLNKFKCLSFWPKHWQSHLSKSDHFKTILNIFSQVIVMVVSTTFHRQCITLYRRTSDDLVWFPFWHLQFHNKTQWWSPVVLIKGKNRLKPHPDP